jgi:hypothetical protein
MVAERGGSVQGYVCFETLADSGYVRHLVVSPDARGAGVGRALMARVAERLRDGGATDWRLNVRPNNPAALGLYRSLGMRTQYESTVLRFDWARIGDLPRGGQPAATAPVTPADDRRIEAAFDFPSGQVARARSVGRILLMLTNAGSQVLGFAAFDPGFPGAFPFRVAEAEYAGPLLDGLHAHAHPDRPRMQVVVDDHRALVAALRGIAAETRDVILHLAGPLPAA